MYVDWNPESELYKFDVRQLTYDEYGRLHSYNDKPAFVGWTSNTPDIIKFDNFIKFQENGIYTFEGCIMRKLKNNICKIWYKNGKIHRDDDKPAFKMTCGPNIFDALIWYNNGKINRYNDKPAMIIKHNARSDTLKCVYKWYIGGVLHRKYLPAVVSVYTNDKPDYMIWIQNGKLYREDDKPVVEEICADILLQIWNNRIENNYVVTDLKTNKIINKMQCLNVELCNPHKFLTDVEINLVMDP